MEYVTGITNQICILAVADSVHEIVLEQYCHKLCTAISTVVEDELDFKYGIPVVIEEYCSELTIGILKSAYKNALKPLSHRNLYKTSVDNCKNHISEILQVSTGNLNESASNHSFQSLKSSVSQKSTSSHDSESVQHSEEECCYVLLEENEGKLLQKLIALQNFSEELWIHILFLVLTDVIVEKFENLKRSSANNCISSEAIDTVKKNKSFPTTNEYECDENNSSVTSEQFESNYTLLDNEQHYQKCDELKTISDISTNPSHAVLYKTTQQSESGFMTESDLENTELFSTEKQKCDSEIFSSRCSYAQIFTTVSIEKLHAHNSDTNDNLFRYTKDIRKAKYDRSENIHTGTIQGTYYYEKNNKKNNRTHSVNKWSLLTHKNSKTVTNNEFLLNLSTGEDMKSRSEKVSTHDDPKSPVDKKAQTLKSSSTSKAGNLDIDFAVPSEIEETVVGLELREMYSNVADE
ncbi:unnamed protein product, partial [Thelazia callipaeda]|uniref:UDENN FNIP1/2-type domain-containing protein n=1 Tax=Thelazia callipaeda TaxID=103827 RepID=A0A0N5CR37_THECL